MPLLSGIPRLTIVCLALLASGYGLHGVLLNDLYLPARYGPGRHYRGAAAILMFGMILSFAACATTVAFSEIDPVRRRITRPLLPSCLFIATFVFMIAGITANSATG